MENEFHTYLDNITIDGETKWFTTPPFDVIKEVAEASDEIFSMVFKKFSFKMTSEECTNLISLIRDYSKDKQTPALDRLPTVLKTRVKKMHEQMTKKKSANWDISLEGMAHMMLLQIINDISIDVVFAKLEQDQATMAKEQYQKTEEIFADIFKKRADLEAETPGVGQSIDLVKEAFDQADNFDLQFQHLISDIPHNVKRYHSHYNGDTVEFNNRCAQSKFALVGVKDGLIDLIKFYLPKEKRYTTDELKAFIVLIIRSVQSMDLNDLKSAAYIHRLLDLIYRYRYVSMDERGQKTFADIEKIIDRYRTIVNQNDKKKKK